jgi:hypothetical protein
VSRDLGGNCVLRSGGKFDGIVMELDQSCYAQKQKQRLTFITFCWYYNMHSGAILKSPKHLSLSLTSQYHTPTEVGTTQQNFNLELLKHDGRSSMVVDHFLFSNWTVVCAEWTALQPLMCYLTDWLRLATNARVSY